MSQENISQEFRLKNIDETRNYFVEEMEQNELMSKKHKEVCTTLNYTSVSFCLEDILKKSLVFVFRRRLHQDKYFCLCHTSSEEVLKMYSRRFQDVFKTSSKPLQNVFKTSCKDVLEIFSRAF